MPVGVEYSITPMGHALKEPFEALYDWVLEYGSQVEVAQEKYDQLRADEKEPA